MKISYKILHMFYWERQNRSFFFFKDLLRDHSCWLFTTWQYCIAFTWKINTFIWSICGLLSFIQFWKVISHYIFKYFFCSILPLFFLGLQLHCILSNNMYIRLLVSLSFGCTILVPPFFIFLLVLQFGYFIFISFHF